MKSTPLPWKVAKGNMFYFVDAADRSICKMLGIESVAKANAEFIVKACNAYPELIEACRKLLLHKNLKDLHPVDFQRLEQALAKAGVDT